MNQKLKFHQQDLQMLLFQMVHYWRSFINRFNKKQPFAAPLDIKRYFITPRESGELCLMSAIFGMDKDIFFPKFREDFQLTSFTDIAENFLLKKGIRTFLLFF